MLELELVRDYLVDGTNGILQVDGQVICHTIELPWKGNKRMESCIPEGVYRLKRRFSPKFQHHFELEGVSQRSYILIHPANHALRELKGCIAPVMEITGAGKGLRSVEAMTRVKKVLYRAMVDQEVFLRIMRS